jgi:pilus assembly protein CpaB
MSRARPLVILLIAVTAGSVFACATYKYVQKQPDRAAAMPTKPVAVAAADLDVGSTIRREDVKLVEWPANALPANVISEPNELVGRGLVLPMIQNEPFLPLKLASKDLGGGLPPVITPGMRAVSVKVNEVIGVAGYVLPGTRVDVVATVSPTMQPQDTTSKVILTNVQVLAAGTKIERDTDRNKPIAVTVVTLLVDPNQAEQLTLAATEGKIQLALRNPLDKEAPATRGIRPAMLVGMVPAPKPVARAAANARPAPTPPPDPTVEIIRGDKRAHEVVRQEP